MSIAFERMTIFCRDLTASLAFYRDLLGLSVIEDKVIEGAAAGGLLQLPPCRIRIVLLSAVAGEAPILGLFEVSGTAIDSITPPRGRPAHGQTALVLRTTEFDALRSKLEAAGTRFLTPPLRYPKSHASEHSPAGVYNEMIAYDPDGVLVSILQIDPLGREAQG